MSSNALFNTLLRPAVLHILRAAGFHSAKSSVVDTLVDLTARYIFLLASKTAQNAYFSHNEPTPTITDVRLAMQQCGLLVPTLTASEEIWKEMLRKPLEEYDEETGARAKEAKRRDAEDTEDVTAFVEWVKGDYNKEISRIAGMLKPPPTATEALDAVELEDYLNSESSFAPCFKTKDTDTTCSSHEKAQQDRRRVTIPRNSSRTHGRSQTYQDRRRIGGLNSRMVSQDPRKGC